VIRAVRSNDMQSLQRHKEIDMSSNAILIRSGGLAAAILAHAAFAGMMLAAQPRPEHYLARLAPAPAPADLPAGVELAQRGNAAALHAVRTLTPTRLLRGTSTC
jgi:hypothetical protein